MKAFERFTLGTDQGDDITLLTFMLSERQAEFTQLISEARSCYFRHEYSRACDFLYQAIEIFPRHTTALYLLARYLVKDGKFREAMNYLNQYNSLRPYNADAYTLLARCAYELGYYLPAVQHLKRSLSLRVENPRALYLLAHSYIKLEDLKEAEDGDERLKAGAPPSKYTKQIQKLLDEQN
jgi:tetratricopeptide (TPR) repeat protein